MAARRRLIGRPLMLASAGMALGCTGFGNNINDDMGYVTGNLVAPPMVQLCVKATPDTATVEIDGQTLGETGCQDAWEGSSALIRVSAEGFETHEQTIAVQRGEETVDVTLTPTE